MSATCRLHAAPRFKKLPSCTNHVAHTAFCLASAALQMSHVEHHAQPPGCVQEGEAEAEEESSSEGPALEAAAALAAVAALVEGLKAFLSPHLSALLHLLFSPPVLACKQAGCSESASSIRIQLAGVMPPRLLLAPLFAHFDGALKVRPAVVFCCS